ncbi:MAG: SDR family NAD(P)-dependent oxidoreductase [Clostridia bacterium]|nr:SDR family NAD(P)-dependent oxidoreductase [Clostridia bacterium]
MEKDIAMINTNIMALHVLTKLYLVDMQTRNQGHILNVGSIAGFMPGPLMTTYYATKNYVVRLSEGIREELRRSKSAVKISVLCPGPVDTNFAKAANVNFNFHGVSSAKVARYAVKHLNQFYIIPTFIVRMARIGMKLLPSTWIARLVYRFQSKRQKA